MGIVTIQGYEYTNEQPPIGFATLTIIDSEYILYGTFTSTQEAAKFGSNLINATVVPIYQPSLH